MLDHMAALPLLETVTENGGRQLLLLHLGKERLPGVTLSTIYFSATGLVTRILANGIDLKFTKEAKPIIEPLAEPAFVE